MKRALVALALVAGTAHADPFIDAAPACTEATTHCFAIHLHVAEGTIEPPWFATQLRLANEHFAAAGVSFRVAKVDRKAPAHVVTRADRTALKPQVVGRVIHVFVTGALDNVDAPSEEIRGVTMKKGATKYVILSAKAPDRVLTHELGHVFLLPHSTYAISLMNKTERADPPFEQRTFHPDEIATIKSAARRFVRDKVLANDR